MKGRMNPVGDASGNPDREYRLVKLYFLKALCCRNWILSEL
jgi:hypothetical protein